MEMAIPITAASVFVALFLIERFLPLRQSTRSLWHRLLINLVITGLAFAVAALLVRPSISWGLGTGASHVGLLKFTNLPYWGELVIGFLLLDLSFYYWHLLNHRVAFLWRFHNVHHIDPDLDVSTAFRFHFGEIAFSALFRIMQITLIGVSLETYLIYELAFTTNTIFHHSNVKLPLGFERWLSLVLVTPRMHGIHHSQVEAETKSNFSVVLPWWDWLHRSLRLNVPQDRIKIGVPAYTQPEDNHLWNTFVLPFRRQRDYWNSQHKQVVDQHPPPSAIEETTLAK
ncbi:sterol desaturase family protein [Thalassoroseus pseudoceratinae]|uniref:sterol desaturase family protein n=1 Tax=Thalassoroseus pseudoceratinae TaxID=2713176 RepID=UPI0014222924|nr:sterol desaturase family protein [Thalassoroseus pseudoceratinae]